MPNSGSELSAADLSRLVKEAADWLDVANHAQTEVEWRVELLKPHLPPGDPALLALMKGERKN